MAGIIYRVHPVCVPDHWCRAILQLSTALDRRLSRVLSIAHAPFASQIVGATQLRHQCDHERRKIDRILRAMIAFLI
jgi:hypothetical protein